MRTLLHWALGALSLLLILTSLTTLCGDIEEAPTKVGSREFKSGATDAHWIDLQDAHLLWSHSVVSYKSEDKKPTAEAVESRDTIYFIPIVAAADAAFGSSKTLRPEQVVAIARLNGEVAAKQFDVVRTAEGKRRRTIDHCVGLRRSYRSMPKKTRALLSERIPGIAGTDVVEIGREPLQKADARGMLFVGLGVLAIWLFWRRRRRRGMGSSPVALMNRYFVAIFSMLGKMAKADGTVSPEEIDVVEKFIATNGLNPAARKQAIKIFNHAKDDPREIDAFARELVSVEPDRDMRLGAYGVLFAIACADGTMADAERRILERLVPTLGLPADTFESMHRQFLGDAKPLRDCYEILGCTEASSDEEVKSVYREKMRKFHPDKIQSKDLPEEFHAYAKQQTQELQRAYQTVMESRKS